jgi:hypothetical protein
VPERTSTSTFSRCATASSEARTRAIVMPEGTSTRAERRKSGEPVTGAGYASVSSETMLTPMS